MEEFQHYVVVILDSTFSHSVWLTVMWCVSTFAYVDIISTALLSTISIISLFLVDPPITITISGPFSKNGCPPIYWFCSHEQSPWYRVD